MIDPGLSLNIKYEHRFFKKVSAQESSGMKSESKSNESIFVSTKILSIISNTFFSLTISHTLFITQAIIIYFKEKSRPEPVGYNT